MADAVALARIHAACFSVPRPWNAAEIADLLRQPHNFLLSDTAGFLIGSALLGEAELLTLAVDPGHRRQGIGARLIAGFLDEASARGAERIFLEVAADNAAAIALYRRAGFTDAGRRRGYYHRADGSAIDALVLSRPG
ncbi:ribosomal protein S18-alanine N-acetyltransferase [Pseudogemmobacter bohemicus]|uniref:ribosomal protein S18-alanine N-acetyltransferase n=1 Tax=Pseudogemmobacter bohemicus TaxID=2250708 RepID=UPI000DD4AD6F|nr:ribosomal protein S18-alanine N-acetyltransferase [Pseudogemmobacter bohemicus]